MSYYITEFGGKKGKFFTRNIFHERDESFDDNVNKFLKKYNNTDTYYCLYAKESKEPNCLLQASFYLDLDLKIENEEDYAEVKQGACLAISYFENEYKISNEQMLIYFSGHKGFHIIIPWTILGMQPMRDLNETYKALASKISTYLDIPSIDTGIYDNRRLFRIPNTINSKTGLYKVQITYKELRDSTWESMKQLASAPRDMDICEPKRNDYASAMFAKFMESTKEQKSVKKSGPKAFKIPTQKVALLPCIKELLVNGAGEGRRNNTAVALASSLMQSGYDREETNEVMLEWNENNDPPLSETELRTTVGSAHGMLSSGRKYGCGAFKELSLCVGIDCKFLK